MYIIYTHMYMSTHIRVYVEVGRVTYTYIHGHTYMHIHVYMCVYKIYLHLIEDLMKKKE